MEEQIMKNPWLGLESYREGEVLFGRDDDIRNLSQSVLHDTVTLLYGKSGIGKSSILNAGVIPTARRHGFLPVMVRLSHKETYTYLYQIKEAIANTMLPIPLDEFGNQMTLSVEEQRQRESELRKRIKEVVECKDNEKETLYEYFHRHTFHNTNAERIKLLIIFDQFEEIFTLQTDEISKKGFFAELADFLNDVMPSDLQHIVTPSAESQKKVRIIGAGNFGSLFKDLNLGAENNLPDYVTDNEVHLVFTIREDFLSEFEYYSASIPSLKQNRYGLRPIHEEQAAQIILRPQPGLISENVAKLIIEKVTGRTDFQLDGIPEIEVDSAVLSLYLNRLYEAKNEDQITSELVEQKGGEIITDFYNDAISEISEDSVAYLENMLLTGQGRRDNITIFDAFNDGGLTKEELDILCNKKKILRQFNYAGDLRIEYVHDILCPVIKKHKEARDLLKQQEKQRIEQEREKQELIRKQKEELERIEKENARQRRRNRYRMGIAFSLMTLVIVGWLGWQFFAHWEFKACYATFTTVNGWPVGVGKKLSNSDKEKFPVYYQLVRYGYFSQNTRVNVLNNEKRPSRNKFFSSPLVSLYEREGTDEAAKVFAGMQRQTAYWIFIPDNEGKLARQTAYNINDEALYSIQFFRSSSYGLEVENGSEKKQLWANYIDKDGKSIRVRDNGADRMRIIVNDATGFYTGYQFFSESGVPQPNQDGAYGYLLNVDSIGRIRERMPLDAFGDSIREKVVIYTAFDEYGRWITTENGNAEYSKQQVVYKMKNRIDSLFFTEHGELEKLSSMIGDSLLHIYKYHKGKVVMNSKSRKKGDAFELAYMEMPVNYDDANITETLTFNADSSMQWRKERTERTAGHCIIAHFKGGAANCIKEKALASSDYGLYHQLAIDTTREDGLVKVTKVYQDKEGRPCPGLEVNREESYYNDNHERVKHIFKRDSTVIYAYLYEYENGQVVSQSVAGVEGKPVRYPGWDEGGLCYYKIRVVYNFENIQVAFKGVNEFGEESLITTVDREEYGRKTVSSTMIEMTGNNNNKVYIANGYAMYQDEWTPMKKNCSLVDYIRIIDKDGSWYKEGIHDGDLLISLGKVVKIARPDPECNTYRVLTKTPKPGYTGAEYYGVYFNERETQRYKNATKSVVK